MKATDTTKIGIGVIGAGIIAYGLYSMKKDTEKILNAPGNFLDGLFGPEGILGGSGLPDTEDLRKAGSTAKSSFIDGLTDGLSKSLGLGLPPSTLNTKLGKSDTKEYKAPETIFETSKETVTMPTIRETLDVDVPSKYVDSVKSGSSNTGNLPIIPASGIKSTDTIFDVKKSLDVNIPMAGASTGTKYTEKASSGSSSKSYTDSTGRTYTPTSTVKARW